MVAAAAVMRSRLLNSLLQVYYYVCFISDYTNNDSIMYVGTNSSMQLQKLERGMLAYQSKVKSVKQYNLSSSSEKALGLPTDCTTTTAADVINNNSSSSAVFCYECSSDSGSSMESMESMESSDPRGAKVRQGSREKDLKDYAYSKALIDFKVT